MKRSLFLAATISVALAPQLVHAQGASHPPPEPLPADLSEAQERELWLELRSNLCEALELEAGIIINTGILPEVPPRIQEMTGLQINQLEQRETEACTRDPADLSTAELRLNVRRLEWLSRAHLVAMRDVTLENPRLRPVAAEGVFADIFELHDTVVLQMREHVRALSDQPTLEEAKALEQFWHEVVQPHAEAEDRAVWDLARAQDDPGLAQSADLLEEEHGSIDEMIARYDEALAKVERGEADISELVPLARSIWQRTELHFGKEEESVYRPLQRNASAEEFGRVIAEQNEAIGDWLRQHGWEMSR